MPTLKAFTIALLYGGFPAQVYAQVSGGGAVSQPGGTPNATLESGSREAANGPGGASPLPTDEIIVTAQKRSERLRDVPLSITAASSDQLSKQGIASVGDLERIVPGFTYRQSQYGTPIFSIRGVGFYDEQVAVAPTVTVYTDQTPLPYARMTEGATLDLERVEVLKGPQGTLFGQNSTGGAINYILAKPTEAPHAGFDIGFGRFNEADFGGYLSGPISSNLTARVALRSEQRGDWQRSNTRNDTAGQRDFLVGRLLVDWKPSDRIKFELNVNGWRDKSDVQVSQARGYLPVNPNPPTTPVTIATAVALTNYPYPKGTDNRAADWDPGFNLARNDEFYQVAGRLDVALTDDLRLVSISSYSHLKTYAPVDVDGTNVRAIYVPIYGKITAFSQEVRLEGKLGDRFKWVIGGDYERDHTSEFQDSHLSGSNSELGGVHFEGLHITSDQRVRDLAAFGNLDLKLTDTLSLQGAVRYTDEKRRFAGGLADSGAPLGFRIVLGFLGIGPGDYITLGPDGAPNIYRTSLDQNNTSWRGSVNWKATPDTLAYANITKGYKAGSFGVIPAVSYLQLTPVTQESVLAYEAGVKTRLLNHKLDLTAAAFYYDYRNKQIQGYVLVPPFGNLPNLVNIPQSRLAGGEIELTYRLTSRLRVTAGATYTDSKVVGNAFLASFFGNSINARGEAFPATPKWQVQGDAEYNIPIGGNKSVYAGGNVSWRSKTIAGFGARSGPPGTQDFFNIDGYALLDLRAGLNIGDRYRFQVYGRNITGTKYWTNVTHIYDTYARVTGFPTTFGATFTARF